MTDERFQAIFKMSSELNKGISDPYYQDAFFDMVTELLRYRQLEDEGRLVELPCRIGDEAYFIKRDYERWKVIKTYIVHGNIKSVKFDQYGTNITVEYLKTGIGGYGQTISWYTGYKTTQVFLTEPEAQAALKVKGE